MSTINNSKPIPRGIPLGVAQCTLLLLRQAIDERNRMTKLRAKTPGMTLWLMPDGSLVYKRRRSAKTKGPQPLLIHEFHAPHQGRIALVSRVINWVAAGHYSALPDKLTSQDLADAFMKGFFREIHDGPAHEKARQAVMAMTKQKLLERQVVSGIRETPTSE